jgi:hypothetical protein
MITCSDWMNSTACSANFLVLFHAIDQHSNRVGSEINITVNREYVAILCLNLKND